MSENDNHNSNHGAPPVEGLAVPEAKGDCLEGLQRLAREVVYQTPEVRPEKVARLKEVIDQETYEIDSAKLADLIIEEVLGKR